MPNEIKIFQHESDEDDVIRLPGTLVGKMSS